MIVLDTHVLVWWLAAPSNLSAKARRFVNSSAAKGQVSVSTISLFEIATLVRSGRLKLGVDLASWFDALQLLPDIKMEPVSSDIARVAGEFEEPFPGDPADRLIAATAIVTKAKLVTADQKIRQVSVVETIW